MLRTRILLVTLMWIRILPIKFDADPDPQQKAQNLEKVLKKASNPYTLACHLQIDADPDPAYHFDVDPDPNFKFDADPDPQHCLLTCV
jgi:hypothetical protein